MKRLFLPKKDAGPLNGTTPGRREEKRDKEKAELTHGIH